MSQEVKGIILCGGEGRRLWPLTAVSNKHLQRVGRKMMVDYPLESLIEAGITKIHVVVGGEHWPPVIKYLGSGIGRGIQISYSVQDKAGGIAEALSLCRVFAGNDKVVVILGDNLFEMSLREAVEDFKDSVKPQEARLFTREACDPERFGVLVRDENGEPRSIVEKPNPAPSKEIVTGIYFYTPNVFDVIRTIRPSARGELEITDVNQWYVQNQKATIIKMSGSWTDCGTFESLERAEKLVGQNGRC